MPKISVCLPTYNGAEYVEQSIISILCQSLDDFELLIADDCSRDGTDEIIGKLAALDNRIKYSRNKRRLGLFGNYNQLFSRAEGLYIKPFAQDDILEPHALALMSDALELDSSLSLVSARKIWIDAQGNDISHTATDRQADMYFAPGKPIASNMVLNASLMPVVNFIGEPLTVMYRNSTPPKLFNESFHHLGDLDLWLRILTKRSSCGEQGNFMFLDKQSCRFRLHKNQETRANLSAMLFVPDMLLLWKTFGEYLTSVGFSYKDYTSRSLNHIADFVHAIGDVADISSDSIRVLPPFSMSGLFEDGSPKTDAFSTLASDYTAYRALLYQSLRILGEKRTVNITVSDDYTSIYLARHNKLRENELKALLRSGSWKYTQILRRAAKKLKRNKTICNRDKIQLLSGNDIKKENELYVSLSNTEISGFGDKVKKEREYANHLKRKIRQIKASRSWKLTRPFRLLSALFGK